MRDRFCRLNMLLLLVLSIAGCNKTNKNFREIKDEGIVIQLNRMEESTVHSDHYSLRIFLSGDETENRQEQLQHLMWYEADSCIYMTDGVYKTYPQLLQPVANGVRNSFEYLIVFDKQPNMPEMRLVYDNQLLRPKTYSFEPAQY